MLRPCKNSSVAVVMCVYAGDSSGQVVEAIDSILKQTLRPDLHIFIDGPISSDIELLLLDLCKSNNNLFLHRSDLNVGLAKGLNTLISHVIGYDYVARMDADDVSLPDRLEKQVAYLQNNPDISVVGSWAFEFGVGVGRVLKKPCSNNNLLLFSTYSSPFIHPTVVFDSKVFRDGLRYPESTYLTEDLAFWYLLIQSGYKLANVPNVLLKYRTSKEMLIRRSGFAKGLSELYVRWSHVRKQHGVVTYIYIYPLLRFAFAIAPISLKRALYSARVYLFNKLGE